MSTRHQRTGADWGRRGRGVTTTTGKRITKGAAAAVGVISALGTGLVDMAPASADGPGWGTPWAVSVGDSYISGEAGRWAGNTNTASSNIDALGPTAYFDNPSGSGETIARCHRSRSAEVFIGTGLSSLNLACSGALTSTSFDSNGRFKPGLDFYADDAGRKGQALMLEEFARTHNVKVIPLSIGGNNFDFGGVVQRCLSGFLSSPSWWQNRCSEDAAVLAKFNATSAANRATEIRNGIANVRAAMARAGYADSSYTIVVQTYMSPIATSAWYRYGESGYTRQSTGGCGFWNADADWMNYNALPTINGAVRNAVSQLNAPNVRLLELSSAFDGRGLCDRRVGLLEERGLSTWQSPGAVDATEWVNQIRTVTTGGSSPYFVQESLHPNYWGQLGLRNCLRQAYNGGSPLSGRCTPQTGTNGAGEPNMTFARQVTVPSVEGLSYTQASSQLAWAGLGASKATMPTCEPFTPDEVILQNPGAGVQLYAGDIVRLTVHVRQSSRLCSGYPS